MPPFLLVGVLGLNLLAAPSTSSWAAGDLVRNRAYATVTAPNGQRIQAEIADTPAKRSQGLMFRTSMPPDHGMLFIFQKAKRWIFWMKNTKMPLDLIWLDRDSTVVHIEANVPICTRQDDGCPRYRPLKDAWYVLELGSGQAEAFEITPGSTLAMAFPARPGDAAQPTTP